MSKSWIQTGAALMVAGLGLLFAGILGLFGYMSLTARPIHPDAERVPSTQAAASPRWTAAVERARTIARAGLIEQNLPGLSVAVGVGGEIVWAEGFGWADIENREPYTPATRFRIGTASKMLTSAAAGLLLERGKLNLDADIQTYVPEFPKKPWPVMVRHLMAHLAGVRRDAGDEENLRVRCDRTVDGIQRFADKALLFEPGAGYRYSNYGWILVSAAVEAASDEPFNAFMRKQIFEPLRMDDTTADSGSESTRDRAIYYFPKFAADPRYGPQPPSEVDYSCFSGASAFLSTPSDIARFIMAVNAGKLLQPDTVRLLQTSQRTTSGQETGYGLGWDLETISFAGRQVRVVGYDGTLRDGMVSSFWTYPNGIVVAVIANTSFADTASLAKSVGEAFGTTSP